MSPDPVEGFGGFMVGRFEQTMNCLDSMQVIDTVNIQRLVLDRLSVFPSNDSVATTVSHDKQRAYSSTSSSRSSESVFDLTGNPRAKAL
jgi:hypothetical protein